MVEMYNLLACRLELTLYTPSITGSRLTRS
jgi:hypothetical protein